MTLPAHLSDRLGLQLESTSRVSLECVLSALHAGAARVLRQALLGVYLTGSFALGRGDEASDVDFLGGSGRAITPQEEVAIRAIHASLPDRAEHWARHLEGSWVSADALRSPVGASDPWLYVDNGSRSMEHSHHDDTWNARWVLRQAGIAVTGPSALTLVPEVTRGNIRAEAVEQADARAAWVRDEPHVLLDGWAQPYIVLTQCRLLWAATFGTVTSKAEAAEWAARDVAPSEYRDLILSSIGYRTKPFRLETGEADPALAAVAAEFVSWATRAVHARANAL